jgi:hypothetical protein
MRFGIQALFFVIAFIAAFFAGRASLTPVIREQERQDVLEDRQIHLQNRQIHLQGQLIETFERARAIDEEARLILERNRKEEELRRLDWMLEMERAHSYRKISRPQFLVPDYVIPKTP